MILLAFPAVAAAQPLPPEPVAPAPPPGAPAPLFVPMQPPPPPPAAPSEPTIRIRAGANGGIALFVPGVSYGANASGRLGIQIKDMIGVYADLGGGFGLGGSIKAGTGGGGVKVDVADYFRVSVMGEFDYGPFFFSLGPTLFKGVWGGMGASATMNGASATAYAAAGYFPALLTRIGFSFGHRHRFSIGLENMLVFGEMTQVTANASQQGASESVHVGASTLGWAPALMLGWDMR